MATWYTVKQGECVSAIAAQYGFADIRAIWDHPQNAALRQRRDQNPNILYPGDRLYIPDKQDSPQSIPTTRTHSYVASAGMVDIRIAVENVAGERMANKPYTLTIDGYPPFTGVTDGDGIVQTRVPAKAQEGLLEVSEYLWTLRLGALNPMTNAPDNGVSGIQGRLHNLGYNTGPIDGILGPLTKAAIRAFQADNPPLVVDGICGPKTRAKLIEKHGC
jgi:N-acetylmuramoyl-L-alanine amidase